MAETLRDEALVNAAATLAERWHDRQEHFFGDDSYFVMHLKPVAGIVRRLGYGAIFVATAFLHDIKEDTAISDTELARAGIPPQAVAAVNRLTKRKHQPHEDYLAGILVDPLAIAVKFADSSFNYSWTMLNSPGISDEYFRAWGLEYAHNLAVLRPALPAPGSTLHPPM